MNPLFKHLTVRLWLTAMMGGALCLFGMPWWQRFFGLNWLVAPALVTLALSFCAIGWALNRTGLNIVGRYVNEASVWERAGMIKEAESALQRATALFDSFWLSPLFRRQRTPWVTAILARFYLGQTARNSHARSMVAAYLRHNPGDDTVAEGWLEQLLNRNYHSAQEYEAAARIGEALGGHGRIQQLLMQFHLNNDRSDFDAMQTYQQVWQQQQPLPPELVRALTRLLLNEGVLAHWALQVYLCDFRSGHQDALDGIAAAVRWLRPTVENRPDLAAARKVVGEIAPEETGRLAGRFKPDERALPSRARASLRINNSGKRTQVTAKGFAASGRSWMLAAVTRCASMGRGAWRSALTPSTAVGGGIAVAVILLIAAGWQFRGGPDAPPAAPPIKPVIEPFTIQVAAYINTEDAQKLVDRLNQSGLEAFWTKATSADRTWYQVKVAHFETKEQAMRYGQELKTKGLIDDFYVANYQKPQLPKP